MTIPVAQTVWRKWPETLDSESLVVNVQGDEPMIEPGDIDQAIAAARLGDAEIVTLMTKMDPAEADDPNRVKVVTDRDGIALYFSRSKIPSRRDLFSPPRSVRLPRGFFENICKARAHAIRNCRTAGAAASAWSTDIAFASSRLRMNRGESIRRTIWKDLYNAGVTREPRGQNLTSGE